MPTVPFASTADRVRALRVMLAIISSLGCQVKSKVASG